MNHYFHTAYYRKPVDLFRDVPEKNIPLEKKLLRYAPWIGFGLGWTLSGPIGLILGSILGIAIKEIAYNKSPEAMIGDYGMALLVLAAAIIRADRKIYNVELKYVDRFLANNFGQEASEAGMILLDKLLKQKLDLNAACHQIVANTTYEERLNLLYFLFRLARRDRNINEEEARIIDIIGPAIGIKPQDYTSIKAMFVEVKQKTQQSSASSGSSQSSSNSGRSKSYSRTTFVSNAYSVLGLANDAPVEAIRKAFKKLAILHHPDKVAHLGEIHRKAAKERFQKINTAYQSLKKLRRLN